MNKKLIHDRFAKNLINYSENARVQKIMAEKLHKMLSNKFYNNVLEIGCGTGFLTQLISDNIQFKNYEAIDIVEGCKDFIAKINSNIKFQAIDLDDFIKNNSKKFDLIISNATFQWVENLELLIKSLKNFLNPNGEILFSIFGKENFREIAYITNSGLNYPSINELQNIFPSANISQEIYINSFDTPKEVLRHIQKTGVNAIQSKVWTKKDLINFENSYKNLCNRKFTLTYNPIYIRISPQLGNISS